MLTKLALEKINKQPIRLKIALAIGVGEQSIMNYIRDNSDNLTKAASLEVIREETGLSDEEILEPAKVQPAETE